MPSPTRQEIIDANNALAALVCVALSNTADPDEKDWIKTCLLYTSDAADE